MADDNLLLIAVKLQGTRQAVGDLQVIKGEIKEVGAESALTGKKLKSMEFNAGLLGTGLGALYKWGKRAAFGLAGIGIASGVAGANFEQHMASVRAVTKATDAQIKMLSDTALHEASVTRFSASEAADGMYRLGRAGFNANQILQAIPGTLNLAHASSIDMATAAQIQAETLRSFGLEAGKAGYVADILAKATQGGAMSMQDLGDAVKYFGATAYGTGQKLPQMIGLLKAMALHSVRGSTAGTTLRQALSRLVNPQKQTGKGLALMGIQASDLYNNKGLKGLPTILDTMYQKLQLLDKVSRKKAISEAFGIHALGGMMAIFNQGPKAWGKFIYQMTHAQGTAKQMADTLNNTLQMRLLRLWHTLEAIGIKFSMAFNPKIKRIIGEIDDTLGVYLDHFDSVAAIIGPGNAVVAMLDDMFHAHGKLIAASKWLQHAFDVTWAFVKTIVLPLIIQWGKVVGALIVGSLMVLVWIMGVMNHHAGVAKFIIGLLIVAYINWKIITFIVMAAQKLMVAWQVLMALRTLAVRAAILLVRAAMILWRVTMWAIVAVQKAMAIGMIALNLIMYENPIILVVAALVLLAIGFYLAYTKIKWFHNAVITVWNWIKHYWPEILILLTGPLGLAIWFIISHWQTVVDFFANIGSTMASVAGKMWDWIKAPFKAAVDWIWQYFKPIYDKIIMVKNWIPGAHGTTMPRDPASLNPTRNTFNGIAATNPAIVSMMRPSANSGRSLAPPVVEPVTFNKETDGGLLDGLIVHNVLNVDGKTLVEAYDKAKSTKRARRGG